MEVGAFQARNGWGRLRVLHPFHVGAQPTGSLTAVLTTLHSASRRETTAEGEGLSTLGLITGAKGHLRFLFLGYRTPGQRQPWSWRDEGVYAEDDMPIDALREVSPIATKSLDEFSTFKSTSDNVGGAANAGG